MKKELCNCCGKVVDEIDYIDEEEMCVDCYLDSLRKWLRKLGFPVELCKFL